jgi:hypothetical protein
LRPYANDATLKRADLKVGPYMCRGLGVHAGVPHRPAAYNAAFTRRNDIRADLKVGPYAPPPTPLRRSLIQRSSSARLARTWPPSL